MYSMRKTLAIVAFAATLTLGLLSAGTSPQSKTPVVPRKAAEFAFKMPNGPEKLLSQYRGKPVVLAFMFTTCEHCQKMATLLNKVQAEYYAKGVQILGAVIDKGGAERLVQFKAQTGATFPIAVSDQGSALEFLGMSQTDPYFVPIVVFIDKTGTIRSQFVGDEAFLANQEYNVHKEIENLLKVGSAAPTAKK
jgi:peroxiredoxin